LKAKKLLKKKTFKIASQLPDIKSTERTQLAQQCLIKGQKSLGKDGSGATKSELTALCQAKIAFVEHLLELCANYRVKAFASIVDRDAKRPEGKGFLRKDYAFLFERFYYFLEDQRGEPQGLVAFDELDKSQCHLLLDQMTHYFRETAKGRMRSSLVIPEPFFVHSHLTTAVQIADIVAYITAWGVRLPGMKREKRTELDGLAEQICTLRYKTSRENRGSEHAIWSFVLLNDLRTKRQKMK